MLVSKKMLGPSGPTHWALSIAQRFRPRKHHEIDPLPEYAPGFGEVSAFISSDREGGLFRRFRELSARNLLYMQSELASLEDDLLGMDEEDTVETKPLQRMTNETCAVDWDTLRRVQHIDERQRRRMALILEIRKLMKEYQKALCLDQRVATLPAPTSSYMKVFRAFTNVKHGGISIRGPPLAEIEQAEYVVTYKAPEVDRLTTLIESAITNSGISLFEEKRRVPESWSAMYFYSDKMVERAVAVIAVLLAAVLLVGGIATLDYVEGKGARLGTLAAFTVAFAAFVGLMTTARRAEMFAATAAFAAVLVVYVSSAS